MFMMEGNGDICFSSTAGDPRRPIPSRGVLYGKKPALVVEGRLW